MASTDPHGKIGVDELRTSTLWWPHLTFQLSISTRSAESLYCRAEWDFTQKTVYSLCQW
jgi:hypothetical protein